MQRNNDLSVLGVILAGGQSRRFEGGDKAFQHLAGRSLIERVIDRAGPQVDQFIISTNADPSRYSNLGAAAVIADQVSGYQGPLAGLAAALSWLSTRELDIHWISTFPVDGPFLPGDLVDTLLRNAEPNGVPAVASYEGRAHPVFGVWPVGISKRLSDYLATSERESIMKFVTSQRGIFVEFSKRSPDPFFNVNTREDLSRAEELAEAFDRDGYGPPTP